LTSSSRKGRAVPWRGFSYVNQIARRVNSGGGVYPDEVDEITTKLAEASGLFGDILEQLSKIK